jgi:malonyl CoA-acyl carrier protein transacylase
LAAVDLALRESSAVAQRALIGPLGRLAAALRAIQRPLVSLWANDDQPVQERLMQAAQHTNDPAAWTHGIRATLAGARHLTPIMELR